MLKVWEGNGESRRELHHLRLFRLNSDGRGKGFCNRALGMLEDCMMPERFFFCQKGPELLLQELIGCCFLYNLRGHQASVMQDWLRVISRLKTVLRRMPRCSQTLVCAPSLSRCSAVNFPCGWCCSSVFFLFRPKIFLFEASYYLYLKDFAFNADGFKTYSLIIFSFKIELFGRMCMQRKLCLYLCGKITQQNWSNLTHFIHYLICICYMLFNTVLYNLNTKGFFCFVFSILHLYA